MILDLVSPEGYKSKITLDLARMPRDDQARILAVILDLVLLEGYKSKVMSGLAAWPKSW
jgi:hypothetical protein